MKSLFALLILFTAMTFLSAQERTIHVKLLECNIGALISSPHYESFKLITVKVVDISEQELVVSDGKSYIKLTPAPDREHIQVGHTVELFLDTENGRACLRLFKGG